MAHKNENHEVRLLRSKKIERYFPGLFLWLSNRANEMDEFGHVSGEGRIILCLFFQLQITSIQK